MTRTALASDDFSPSVLYPRLLHFGVAYSDVERVTAESLDWHSWSTGLASLAERYNELAQAEEDQGHSRSASQLYRLASIYFHYAQVRLPLGALREEYRNRSVYAFHKSIGQVSFVEHVEIPFGDTSLPGYFWSQQGSAPLVILIGGLDSAKEVELLSFAQTFSQRGLNCLFFDGPGQGELLGRLALNFKFEEVLDPVVDFAIQQFQPKTLGVFGVSLGGYLAARAAAANPSIDACVSLGGFFDTRPLQRLSSIGQNLLRASMCLPQQTHLPSMLETVSVEDAAPVFDRPLLVVHGTKDHLVDDAQISLFEKWMTHCASELRRVQGAEHVCTDRFNECLPLIGDWTAEQLFACRN